MCVSWCWAPGNELAFGTAELKAEEVSVLVSVSISHSHCAAQQQLLNPKTPVASSSLWWVNHQASQVPKHLAAQTVLITLSCIRYNCLFSLWPPVSIFHLQLCYSQRSEMQRGIYFEVTAINFLCTDKQSWPIILGRKTCSAATPQHGLALLLCQEQPQLWHCPGAITGIKTSLFFWTSQKPLKSYDFDEDFEKKREIKSFIWYQSSP